LGKKRVHLVAIWFLRDELDDEPCIHANFGHGSPAPLTRNSRNNSVESGDMGVWARASRASSSQLTSALAPFARRRELLDSLASCIGIRGARRNRFLLTVLAMFAHSFVSGCISSVGRGSWEHQP
jgi:hypothetical protein